MTFSQLQQQQQQQQQQQHHQQIFTTGNGFGGFGDFIVYSLILVTVVTALVYMSFNIFMGLKFDKRHEKSLKRRKNIDKMLFNKNVMTNNFMPINEINGKEYSILAGRIESDKLFLNERMDKLENKVGQINTCVLEKLKILSEDMGKFASKFDTLHINNQKVVQPTIPQPTIQQPTIHQPTIQQSTIQRSKVDEQPKVEESKVEESKVEERPKAEQPKVEESKVEERPKAERPKVEESKIEESKVEEQPKVDEQPMFKDPNFSNDYYDIHYRKFDEPKVDEENKI